MKSCYLVVFMSNKKLFLIYINDLPRGLHADIKLFAVDTLLLSVVNGKCLLILTELNQLLKLNFLKKIKMLFTLIFTLTTCQLFKQHLKSTWDLT